MQSFREQFFIAIAQNNLVAIQQLYENKSITLYETNALAQSPTVVALSYTHQKIAFWLRCQYARDLFNSIKLIEKEDSEGAVKCVREHLQYDPHLIILDENKHSLLHLAVARNDKHLVTYLLKIINDNYEIELSSLLNGEGLNCLEFAIKSNNLDMALHVINVSNEEAISWDATRLVETLALSRKLDKSKEDGLLKQCILQYVFPFSFNQSAIGNLLHTLIKKEDSEIIQVILQKSRVIKIELIEQLIEKGDLQPILLILRQFPALQEQVNDRNKYLFEIFAEKDMWDMALLSLGKQIPFDKLNEFLVNAITIRSKKQTPDYIFHAFMVRCIEIYGDNSSFYEILHEALVNNNQAIFALIWDGLSIKGKGICLTTAAASEDWNMLALFCENLPCCKFSSWYDELLLKIIATRNTGANDELLLTCIHRLLQVGMPGDIRHSEGQNWIHRAALKADFKVMFAFLRANLEHLRWFFEEDINALSPLEILVQSKGFIYFDKEFMNSCLAVIKAINSIPPVTQEIPRPSFFYDTKHHHCSRVRTRTLNQVFAVMEIAESRHAQDIKIICQNISKALLEKEVDITLLHKSSDYVLKFLAINGYNRIVLQLCAQNRTCTHIPEVKRLDYQQQHLLKYDIPMLLLLARRDIRSFFAYLPQALTRLICYKAVYDYLSESVIERGVVMKNYQGLHPFYESTHLIEHSKIPGKEAFAQFQDAHRRAHSKFNKGSNESQILMTDLANIAFSDKMAFAVKGSIFMRMQKFISDRYANGNFSETTTIKLLKQYDFISDKELSGIRKQQAKATIKTMVVEFNKLNSFSKSSNNLMKDLLEMANTPNMSQTALYKAAREHSLDYLRARAVKNTGKIEKSKTVLLLQKYQDITDEDIFNICSNYQSKSVLEQVQVDENEGFDFCLMK